MKIEANKNNLILKNTKLFLTKIKDNSLSLMFIRESKQLAQLIEPLELGDSFLSIAILYPMYREKLFDYDDLKNNKLDDLYSNLEHLSQLDKLALPSNWSAEQQLSNKTSKSLKKMLLSISNDPKLILIKIAIHLNHLRHAKKYDKETQKKLALSTNEIYAPLANRLGVWQLKWELEDLSFRFLNTDTYKNIAKLIKDKRSEREVFIAEVTTEVKEALEREPLSAVVSGRPKHIFSIWKKLQRKNISIENIFDIHAIRICVETIPNCYRALGTIHNLWTCLPDNFKDYIANPKKNNYQSLHTSIIGPNGKTIEVQIRTHAMQHHAELGIAAHWRYKEGTKNYKNDKYIEEIRNYLTTDNYYSDALEISQKNEDRIFAISPKGDVIEMIVNSTPLDFAYHVHTNIGHSCIGAKINGKIAPLNRKILNGDLVQIITGAEPNPRRDWLNPQLGYIASTKTRSKINNWFRAKNKVLHLKDGKEICDNELKRSNISNIALEVICKQMNLKNADALYIGLGSNAINSAAIAMAIQVLQKETTPIKIKKTGASQVNQTTFNRVSIAGMERLLSSFSQCCKPLPPEQILGYITVQKGISIHRYDCKNALNLAKKSPERIIDVNWNFPANQNSYPIDLEITAYDRRDLLRDISNILSEEKITVRDIKTSRNQNSLEVLMTLNILAVDLPSLSRLMIRFEQLKNIASVTRK